MKRKPAAKTAKTEKTAITSLSDAILALARQLDAAERSARSQVTAMHAHAETIAAARDMLLALAGVESERVELPADVARELFGAAPESAAEDEPPASPNARRSVTVGEVMDVLERRRKRSSGTVDETADQAIARMRAERQNVFGTPSDDVRVHASEQDILRGDEP